MDLVGEGGGRAKSGGGNLDLQEPISHRGSLHAGDMTAAHLHLAPCGRLRGRRSGMAPRAGTCRPRGGGGGGSGPALRDQPVGDIPASERSGAGLTGARPVSASPAETRSVRSWRTGGHASSVTLRPQSGSASPGCERRLTLNRPANIRRREPPRRARRTTREKAAHGPPSTALSHRRSSWSMSPQSGLALNCRETPIRSLSPLHPGDVLLAVRTRAWRCGHAVGAARRRA
jgi:hypothetical protein